MLFRALAKAHKVDSVTVDGKFGKILGSPLDVAIFGEYLTTQNFSPQIITFILSVFHGNNNKGTFIDIGAHVGLMSIPVAKSGEIECVVGIGLRGPLHVEAYSDHHADIPLLNQVDHAVAVNPTRQLLKVAQARSLDVADWGT